MDLEKLGPLFKENIKNNRFRGYLLIHGLVVVLVLFLFRAIPEKKYAALLAGFLFISAPSFVVWTEIKIGKAFYRFSTWGALVFLVASAIPIFTLRVIYWSEPFAQITFLGFSAREMHTDSNFLFIGLLFCFVVDSIWQRVRAPKK